MRNLRDDVRSGGAAADKTLGGTMWKKDEEQVATTRTGAAPVTTTRAATRDVPRRAVIGPSITIKGDVTGSEDLLIEGVIDGSVTLDQHAVGVGSEGRVQAAIVGRVITVEGRVEGNLQAKEQIVLRGSANVLGDIKAPRVVLEDGATFRGLVDMGTPPAKPATDAAAKDSGAAAGTDTASETNGVAASGSSTAVKKNEATASETKSTGSKGARSGRTSASAK